MTPAFGFSAGDFVNAISKCGNTYHGFGLPSVVLIRKISKALKQTGGASAEYQDAVLELKSLKHTLRRLEALEPTEDNSKHVNAIRGMALACQLPLRDFLIKLESFESALGPWANQTSFCSRGRKAKWAIEFKAEVEKLRALVVAKQISINLLLTTQVS